MTAVIPDGVEPFVDGEVGDLLPPPHAPASIAAIIVSPSPVRMIPPGRCRSNRNAATDIDAFRRAVSQQFAAQQFAPITYFVSAYK
jgi:hypothetical protein